MQLSVNHVEVQKQRIETPEQADYILYPCPICQQTEHLQTIGVVRTEHDTSIESAFCQSCQHRFHRKFPHAEWLQRFYENEFEQNKQVSRSKPILGAGTRWLKRKKAKLGRLIRYGTRQEVPNRIYDFCSGVLKGDYYYDVDKNVNKILEIGCGSGWHLTFFRNLGFETYGTEPNKKRRQESINQGLTVYPADPEGWQAVGEQGPFDFIYSTHVLEHIIDIDGHIRDLAACVRDKGFLYIETPNINGESFVQQTHQIYHVQTFTLQSMLKLMRKHGFKPIRVFADNNIRVLYQKCAETDFVLNVEEKTGCFNENLLGYMQAVQQKAQTELEINWDYYYIEVMQTANHKTLYRGGLDCLAIKPGRIRHRIQFCNVSDANASLFPIEFVYPQQGKPPIWCKE